MTAAYKHEPTSASADPFAVSRGLFDALIESASTMQALRTGHETIERAIFAGGQRLLNQLYQDHLDLRATHERRVEVVSEDGVRRVERRQGQRTLRSLLGQVVWTRCVYQAPDRKSVV